MHLTGKRISEIAFLAMVLISAISLADATSKYIAAYDALANFKIDVTSLNFASTPNNLTVTIKLKIVNPTSYSDLNLNGIIGLFSYEGENHTVKVYLTSGLHPTYEEIVTPWWQLPESEADLNRPISPYSITNILMNLTAYGDDAKSFNTYFEKQGALQENIKWQLTFNVSLDIPIYLKTQNLQYQFDR